MLNGFMYNSHPCPLALGWERMLPIKRAKLQWFYAVKRDITANICSFMLHRKIFPQIIIIVIIIIQCCVSILKSIHSTKP